MAVVTIKAKAMVTPPVGSVRAAGDPRRTNVNVGPVWKYNLDPGTYVFNVDYSVVGGNTASFTFTNATPDSATGFTPPGVPGAVVSDNEDILFTV